jgi:hypothetical protein
VLVFQSLDPALRNKSDGVGTFNPDGGGHEDKWKHKVGWKHKKVLNTMSKQVCGSKPIREWV